MDGIKEIAGSFGAELKRRLPKQRKTQRTKLALLVATMLDVRSANLMDLAAGLPREADRTDMRYQWITRLLGNPLVVSDEIMEPFSREVLERAAAGGQPLVLILDQSKVSDRHQVLMLALRCGERALPLAWRVEETDGAIGFETQKALLDAVAPWLPSAGQGPADGRPLLRPGFAVSRQTRWFQPAITMGCDRRISGVCLCRGGCRGRLGDRQDLFGC